MGKTGKTTPENTITVPAGGRQLRDLYGFGSPRNNDWDDSPGLGFDPAGRYGQALDYMGSGQNIAGLDPMERYGQSSLLTGAVGGYDPVAGRQRASAGQEFDYRWGAPRQGAYDLANGGADYGAKNAIDDPSVQYYNQWQAQNGGSLPTDGGNVSGAFDPYYGDVGSAADWGVNETRGMTNQYQSNVMQGLDRELELSLDQELTGVSDRMQSLGLGRSGAATYHGGNAMNAALDAGNRAKFQTMAGFNEAAMGREADAIRASMGMRGQAGMEGMQLSGQAYMAGQEQAHNRYLSDSQNMSGLMSDYGRIGLDRQLGEQDAQSEGLRQLQEMWGIEQSNLVNARNDLSRAGGMNRDIENQRNNAKLEAWQMPWRDAQVLATGVSGAGPQNYATTNVWEQEGAKVLGNVATDYLNDQ